MTTSRTPIPFTGNDNLDKSLTYHGFGHKLIIFVGLNLGGLSSSGNESVGNATTRSSRHTSNTKMPASFTFKPSSSGLSQHIPAEKFDKKWASG